MDSGTIAEPWHDPEAIQPPSHHTSQIVQQAGSWCDDGEDGERASNLNLEMSDVGSPQARPPYTTERVRDGSKPTLHDSHAEPFECVPRHLKLSGTSSLAVSPTETPDSPNVKQRSEGARDTSGMSNPISGPESEREKSRDDGTQAMEMESVDEQKRNGPPAERTMTDDGRGRNAVAASQSDGSHNRRSPRSINPPRFRCKSAPCNVKTSEHRKVADRYCLEEGNEAFTDIEAGTV